MSAIAFRARVPLRKSAAGQLRREQRAGTIAATVDVEVVAELMTRLSCSFLLTPSHVIDLDDADELRQMARRFLVPMLEPGSQAE